MYITRQDEAAHVPEPDNPIFIGDAVRQVLVGEDQADSLRVASVSFRDGAYNKWHMHPTEQVLYVTSGRGIIATNDGETEITMGDTVVIPAGERHWHGAAPGASMTHLSILLPGTVHIEVGS